MENIVWEQKLCELEHMDEQTWEQLVNTWEIYLKPTTQEINEYLEFSEKLFYHGDLTINEHRTICNAFKYWYTNTSFAMKTAVMVILNGFNEQYNDTPEFTGVNQ